MLAVALFAASAVNPILKSEFIFQNPPFASCHAATLAETSHNGLVAAWFGGSAESNPDVAIYTSRLLKGHWEEPKLAAKGFDSAGKQVACYNPVLFQTKHGPLLLFFKAGTGPQHWWGLMTRSNDEGRTWQAPRRLPDGFLGPIKNKPIELTNGVILCPSSTEDSGWRIHFEFTSDFGRTWRKTASLNEPSQIGAIQPSLLQLGGKRLRALGRTQQGRIFSIDSPDLGETWSPMRLLDLPNPNSGIDAVTLADGRHLLVYNASTTKRTPLSVAISADGEHWNKVLDLETEPGEYSYPAIIQTDDGLVHIAYTWNRKLIKHVVLDPALIAGP
jgi:predicted neuraminidase